MWESITKFISENYQVIGICGMLFAFYKWHVSQKQKEVEILHTLIKTLRSPEVLEFIRKSDYDVPWYDEKFHNSQLEETVDSVLIEYSYLCHLKKTRMIANKTFDFFRYDICTILSDSQMIDYFYNLYQYTCSAKTIFPFIHLLNYAFDNGFANKKVFDNPDAWKDKSLELHNYYLNFRTGVQGKEEAFKEITKVK